MLEKSSGWVWSGEGGSVGMGHVYLDENLVSIARSGDLAAVCRHFIESGGRRPPAGIFSSSVRAEVIQAPYDGLMAELTALHPNDPGKVPLLFLLHNDQRRHLSEYFENLDQVRFELALPFFDARVLETIIRAPIDWFLRHRLYNQWLTVFGDELSRTPWQVYPGHEGPVNTAAVPGLRNQWEDGWLDREQLRRRARSFLPKTLALLNGTDFPDNVLSRARLWMAYLATKIGAKDYGYALNAALIVHRYAACSNVRDANV